ncbi:antibiotic biosynthesis monooxygenase [Phormidium sp. CLA17]|uniref:antibiotic biosynthesis monooxygenase n=1 Tax=Leptolyngbya sp. Cla-17 TaxID=2803751 RepID=UPI0018D77B0F|nr:antibiotic biosynthesis monooxygenase [Leptolyngbya sp. Cla-17]MBM0740989.1 antibiotic biosynthesis monooxygenase [Leptolyngbya sp. Cla-17]
MQTLISAMSNVENLSHDPPTTIDILQRVKPGCEAAFEVVLTDLLEAAKGFEGHLGVNVFRPSDHANPEYRIVFKFDRVSHLKQWEASAIRQKLLERAKHLTVGSSQVSILTGLETWFTLPQQPSVPPPPRYKMMVISGITIYVLISLINLLIVPLINPLPLFLRTLVVTLLMVAIMTYVAMPRMTKLFAGWLYPKVKH